MLRRFITIALLAAGVSIALVNFGARSLELFFLDWKQIVGSGAPPSTPIKILDVTHLKRDINLQGERIEAKKILKLLWEISSAQPRSIIITIPTSDIGDDIAAKDLAKELKKIPKIYLITRTPLFTEYNFASFSDFDERPALLNLTLTNDSQIDNVSRRIIVHFDLDRKQPSQDFVRIPNVVGKTFSHKHFTYDFPYLETQQVYMKIWPFFNYGLVHLSKPEIDSNLKADLFDKVVIVGTSGIYSLNSNPSIKRRLNFSTEQKLDLSYEPASQLVATYLANFITGEYVKQPTNVANGIWLFLGLFTLYCSLFLASIRHAFVLSSLSILIYVLISFLAFRIWSINVDTGKGLVIGILSQYAILSYRYLKHIRMTDREKFLKEKEAAEEKLRSRALVRVAIADSTLRMVGQVSHDIRSPLTALQITGTLLQGNIPKDLHELLTGATERIRNISEDLLLRYKEKGPVTNASEVNLQTVLSELCFSFKKIYPTLSFEMNGDFDIRVPWSRPSMQRSFSNLFLNSIEACRASGVSPMIRIHAQVIADRIIIAVSDNGPGVPVRHIDKLFREGGTFEKDGGTGLGLYQVKTDLALIGGTIKYRFEEGACFEISLPLALGQIEFTISPEVVLVEGYMLASDLTNLLQSCGAKVSVFARNSEAIAYLMNHKRIGEVTLACDLVIPGQDETGFDLLDACKDLKLFKRVIITTLADNSEVQSIANKKNALLMQRSFLEALKVKMTPKEL